MNAMLDSDTCIYLMNRHPRMVAQEPLHKCCISSVVLGELEYGCLNSQRVVENRAKVELFLGNIAIAVIGEAEAKAYAELRMTIKSNIIGPNDLWIAAHALALDLPIVTNNDREFGRVPNLVVDNWMQDGN